jgi:hypothetical protein
MENEFLLDTSWEYAVGKDKVDKLREKYTGLSKQRLKEMRKELVEKNPIKNLLEEYIIDERIEVNNYVDYDSDIFQKQK